MDFITEISDWIRNKTRIFEGLNFLNSFAKVDDTKGIDQKELIFYTGNSEIRLSREKIEVAHGIYKSTKIVVEKNRIYFNFQNGQTVDLEDINRVLQFFYREQPDSGGSEFEALAPLYFDGEFLSVGTANAFQAGVISPDDWLVFNSKQNGSIELTSLSQIIGNGIVYRNTNGSYSTTSLILGTMANQNANNVGISGGSIHNTVIGVPTPALGNFSKVTLIPPTTSDVPLTINTLTSGADTIQIIRQDNTIGFRLLNSGSVEVGTGSFYRHSGNPVVGARRTGWGGSNGTVTWSQVTTRRIPPANTASPTTVELMQTLSGLIADLTAHGLIGT